MRLSRRKLALAEALVAFVLELGVPISRDLVDAIAGDERRERHAARELAKVKIKRAGQRPKARRGFAVMNPDLVRTISSRGGRAAHARGSAHEFSRREARTAGSKGGSATAKNRRTRAKSVS